MTNLHSIPAKIVHIGKPDRMYAMDTVHLAARSMHLTWEVERQMLYYAQCANGFRPSEEMVSQEAHVQKFHVYNNRQTLQQFGFLTYNKDEKTITVHWDRIKIYATLDASLTKPKHKENLYIAPVDMNNKPVTIKESSKQYKILEPRKLTPAQKKFYDVVGKMTADEWTGILVGLGVEIGTPMNLSDDELKHYDLDPVEGVHPYTDLSEMPWSGELPVMITKKLPF